MTNTPTFMDPSEKALMVPADKTRWFKKYEPYFIQCPVDKSFKIELNDVKETTLRPAVSKFNKDNGKKFKVVVHESGYEIYRKE